MPALVRPSRSFSFADHAKNPRAPFPGDRLDVQIQNLIEAIHSTQQALGEIRRADGKLKNQSVGADQLALELRHSRGEIDELEQRVMQNAHSAIDAAVTTRDTAREIHLRAQDAERAAVSAAQFLSAVNAAKQLVDESRDTVVNALDATDAQTSDAENWANYAQVQATNAQTEEQMAAAWAEYLAGPVVDSTKAPAYISGTPWGTGLYYQPVQGMGGMGGLWSAKWWAIYAGQLVGGWNFYYLGAWAYPPAPGTSNPSTGIKVPNPLAVGSFYYDTTAQQLYVWNGGAWVSPYVLTPGYQSTYVYVATAGQTVFSGADSNGHTPVVGQSSSDVHLNGVRLVAVTDYTIDTTASKLTLNIPASINSIVQWDLLVPASQLAPGAVNSFKGILNPSPPDGVTTVFSMTYTHPTLGNQPVNVTNGAQLQVSLDGVIQEPGVDYNASGASLTMAKAPPLGAHFWVLWYSNAVLTR
jgi:hypothetical protein